LADRTISINLEKFKKIKTKITIASGKGKAVPVLSALRGRLIDVLITDYELGTSILKLNNK